MIFYSIAYTFIDILGTYSTYYMFKTFFRGREKNKFLEISSYFISHIISAIIYLAIGIPMVTLITTLLAFYIVTLNYEASTKERVISVALNFFIQASAETLVIILSGIRSIVTEQNELLSLTTHINTRVVGFILIMLICKIRNGRLQNQGGFIGSFVMLSVPLSVMYLTILLQPNAISGQPLVFSIIILILMNLISFYLYSDFLIEENHKKKLLEREIDNYLLQYKMVMGYSKEFNKMIHDMKNHVLAINYLLEKDNKEELVRYVNENIQKSIKEREYLSSGNMSIDSVLNNKIFEAESYGIKMGIRMAIPEDLMVQTFELMAILINLIEHAITETKDNSLEFKIIDVLLSYNVGILCIKIIHFEEGDPEAIRKKYLLRRREYKLVSLNVREIRKAIKALDGNFSIEVSERKVVTLVMLPVPLDIWIKEKSK